MHGGIPSAYWEVNRYSMVSWASCQKLFSECGMSSAGRAGQSCYRRDPQPVKRDGSLWLSSLASSPIPETVLSHLPAYCAMPCGTEYNLCSTVTYSRMHPSSLPAQGILRLSHIQMPVSESDSAKSKLKASCRYTKLGQLEVQCWAMVFKGRALHRSGGLSSEHQG